EHAATVGAGGELPPHRLVAPRIEGRESGEMYELAVEGHDARSLAVAQPHRRAGDGVEDWLHVRRRARYHTQDLAARLLLLNPLPYLPPHPFLPSIPTT